MKKTKVKIPAKINLSLDVLGVENGYHNLSSIVSSINIYDEIILSKRADKTITLKESKIKSGCPVLGNNAYKAVNLYMQTFDTQGVDIILKKNIPVGAGLGGSSADIAGALIAVNKLFNKGDILPLANSLGSDSGYMTSGGLAEMYGRGDKINKLNYPLKLYLNIIKEDKSVSSKQCYKTFDEINGLSNPTTKQAIEFLSKGNIKDFVATLKNDLTVSAEKLLPIIKTNIEALESAGCEKALLTGSGSAVYGIYFDRASRNKAYKKLKSKYGKNLLKAETL